MNITKTAGETGGKGELAAEIVHVGCKKTTGPSPRKVVIMQLWHC